MNWVVRPLWPRNFPGPLGNLFVFGDVHCSSQHISPLDSAVYRYNMINWTMKNFAPATWFVTMRGYSHTSIPCIPKPIAGPYLIFVISFTQAAFSNSKFYTQKLTKNTPKHSKMSLKSKIYVVLVFNLENFTPDRIVLHGHRPWCPWQLWGMSSLTVKSQKSKVVGGQQQLMSKVIVSTVFGWTSPIKA